MWKIYFRISTSILHILLRSCISDASYNFHGEDFESTIKNYLNENNVIKC